MHQNEKPRLLASIHDVGPRFEAETERLVTLYDGLGLSQFAMLVVPNHWNAAPLWEARDFQAKLRGWAEAGVEIFVHGWFHRDTAAHSGLSGLKARHLTASEGEFLGLSSEEAGRRMAAGRALIEDIVGRPVCGFIAPAWLYGPGARVALSVSGFDLAEDHFRVWQPADGRVLARGPVVTWASRSKARIASSLVVGRLAPLALRAQKTVRVAVHPGDVHVPALVANIKTTLSAFLKRRQQGRYAGLARHGGS